MIEDFFDSLNATTVIFFLLSFLILLGAQLYRGGMVELDKLVNEALTLALIPTGFALLVCAFSPAYVGKLEGLQLNIAIAGVVLLFIPVRTAVRSLKGRTDGNG